MNPKQTAAILPFPTRTEAPEVPSQEGDPELAAMLAQYDEAQADKRACEARIADMREALLARLAEGTTTADGWRATVGRMPPTRTLDRERFDRENTELREWLDAYYVVREGAVTLRVSKPKGRK